MAEHPPNEQLHPFFRPRSKVDNDAELPCVAPTLSKNEGDRPRPTARIPAIFLQQPSAKGTAVSHNESLKQSGSEQKLSECFLPWPGSVFQEEHYRQKELTGEEVIEQLTGWREDKPQQNMFPNPFPAHRGCRQPLSDQSCSQFFSHQRATRQLKEMQATQPPVCETSGQKYQLPSRSKMISLLDTLYPEGWRTKSCTSLFDYLYPIPNDDHAMPTSDPRSVPWRDKYRPLTIDGLLGNDENCTYLRDWLQEMKVSPIVAPSSHGQKPTDNPHVKVSSTSKRKSNIPAELQDFIVENDADDLAEYGFIDIMSHVHDADENDDDFMPSINRPRKRKQATGKAKKMEGKASSNLILLVGCHGVGKTAAVYTAANEVGYDVFEIHAGQKRNAKDILAMVGEMAESHQVSFDSVNRETFDPFAMFAKAAEEQVNSDTSKKLESSEPTSAETGKRKRGRPKKGEPAPKVKKSKPGVKGASGSGDITKHFLKMKVKSVSPPPETITDTATKDETDPSTIEATTKEDTPTPPVAEEATYIPSTTIQDASQVGIDSQTSDSTVSVSQIETEARPPTPSQETILPCEARSPRQSLILLEEVDILYEDDKTFWSAVISLAQKSKRPIVMTCNDIGLVPYEVLALQATLYFELPPIEATTQYLQLVCMAEGYLIDPSELYYLCIIFGQDLRKLLNSLELWSRKPAFSRDDSMSLYVHRCLIEEIIGSEVMFHDQIATLLAQRRAIYSEANSLQDVSIEKMMKAYDTQSYIDSFLKDQKADQIDEIDEYEPSKDNTLGYKILWKEPSHYDHWDMDGRIVKTASSLNQQILPNIAIARSTRETTSILSHPAYNLMAPLLSLRTKVQGTRSITSEFLPYILSICKSDNAMMMEQIMPTPGLLRATRRRTVRSHLWQLTQEQSQQLESIGKLHIEPSITHSNGMTLRSRFDAAIRLA